MSVAREMVGAAVFDRFVETLPPHLADYFLHPRLATNWLPLDDCMAITRHILDELLDGDFERVFEVARRQFKADLSTVYRVFVRLGSVAAVARRTATVYATYSRNAGSMSVVREEDHLIEVEVIDHPSPSPHVWQFIRGNVHGAAEASGAHAVKTSIVDGGGNRPRCRIRVTWS